MALAQTAARTFSMPAIQVAAIARGRADIAANALQSIGSVCRFDRNEAIFSDGDDAKHSYKVISGVVRLVKLMPDGRRHVAGFQLAGDIFGIEWSDKYALTAEAVSEVVAIRYSCVSLERLGDERPDVRKQITDRLRDDLRAAHVHLISLGCQTAKERVASFLLMLARRTDIVDRGTIEMQMGRQDIADYLGLTIETVCRTLSGLRETGVIAIPTRHQIVLNDIDCLEAVAESDTDV